MTTDNERLDGRGPLPLWVRLARIEGRRPQNHGFVLASQRDQAHGQHVVVDGQWRFNETVGELQIYRVYRQQLLAQNGAILQRQPTDATDQTVRLTVFDDALRDRRVPLADFPEALEYIPNALGAAVYNGAVFNFCHDLSP